ncbi:MAG: DinB family protein [Candidatus Heimdallarchaeota archaeon]
MAKNEPEIFSGAIQEQYGAAIAMLEKVVDNCPEDVWDERTSGPPFWQVAYHTMWYLDWYLSGSKKERQAFTSKYEKGLEDLRNVPEKTLSSKQLISYLDQIRSKARNNLGILDTEMLSQASVFEWHGNSILSSSIYNIRHVMLHIGALHSRLLRKDVELRNWVSHAPLSTAPESKD